MSLGIDFAELRRRIANTPVFMTVRRPVKPVLSDEELAKRRERDRLRAKEWRKENVDRVRELERRWRKENPEKVKAKKKRYEDAHKDDPEYLEKKRARQRRYLAAHKDDPEFMERIRKQKKEYRIRSRHKLKESQKETAT